MALHLLVFFISIKSFKDWQQKLKENFDLQKENAHAEMQFLKAQIHPHFYLILLIIFIHLQ